MTTISTTATGISPAFQVSAEEFIQRFLQGISRVSIDGVEPPTLGAEGGYSAAMTYINLWSHWIDDKLVEPKYDGICVYLGVPSNRPSLFKDYHLIALMRATDRILDPEYEGLVLASVDDVTPEDPTG